MSIEKHIFYETTNTYSTLNNWTAKTKTVWVVLHGIGYLSRYFLKYFKHLNPEENYIIAPQAPSKYYLNGDYRHVGASWLTRENTELETENVLNYLDEIYKVENFQNTPNLIIFGYSQGVSIITRWVAKRKISCDHLIMHSGKVPAELNATDFDFLKNTRFSFIYGSRDEFLNEESMKFEENRLKKLFPKNFEIISFDGPHEVNKEFIANFS